MRKLRILTLFALVASPFACESSTTAPGTENPEHRSSRQQSQWLCQQRPTPYACTPAAHRGATVYAPPSGTPPEDKLLCCAPFGLCVEVATAAECPYTNVGLCPDGSIMDHGDGIYSCND